MIRLMHRNLVTSLLTVAALFPFTNVVAMAADDSRKISAEHLEFFESKIRPIFVKHCYECHSAKSGDDLEGSLLLDSRIGWQTGGDSGPAVVSGKVEESLIIHAVRYEEDLVSAMPPKSKLADKDIKLLEQWIEMGAPDPREPSADASASLVEKFDLQKRYNEHWSWRPIQNPEPPTAQNSEWPLVDIDRFVLAKLEAQDIKPAAPADREIWIRRVYFDLIGLPPTVEQIDAFLADKSDDAHATVVDQLLDSPHFGEKWARHWMDLVRYAETYGHEFDYPIVHAHHYRDYLIRALNADVPYDQFVREHIAGDLMNEPRRHPTQNYNESIIGTGFWYFHEATHAPTDVLTNEADITDNQLDVFGKAFLGLTVACARCHDHKFDAISTADYYALSAYLQSSCRQNYPLDPNGRIASAVDKLKALRPEYLSSLAESQSLNRPELDVSQYYETATELIRAADPATGKDGLLPRPDKAAIDSAAKDTELDSARLENLIDLLCKAKPKLSNNPDELLAFQAAKANRGKEVEKYLQRLVKDRTSYAQRNRLLADFADGKLPDGWTTSGHAFQMVDTKIDDRTWVPLDVGYRSRPATVDSAVFGQRASGVLRTNTFELTHRNIHLKMRATANARVRVIIDNYQLAHHNALLFRGTELIGAATDTKGQWAWKTLGNDLRKYVGHQVYLEFVDEGDQAIAVDEIWLSDEGVPPHAPERLAAFAVGDDGLSSHWERATDSLRSNSRSALLDWCFEKGLIATTDVSPAHDELLKRANKIAAEMPRPMLVIAMAEGTKENAHVYVRGSAAMLGEEVPPRTLTALGGQQGNRLELAQRIASLENPLTARVMVNRIWHHLFGRGIVPTVDDFGPQGQPASHPQLLDHLATKFVADGWSIKNAIRNMVLSQTYRQSATTSPKNDPSHIATADPTNALLHRMRVRRLPAESIRDSILAISGRLDQRQFGPSVATHRTEFMTGRGGRKSGPLDGAGRRSVYLSIYRNFLNPFMLTFDMPNPFGPKGRRSNSNVPAQALTLMNDPFVLGEAKRWGETIAKESTPADARIQNMVRKAHGITPTSGQVARLSAFVNERSTDSSDADAWSELSHALFNMKAFYFLR